MIQKIKNIIKEEINEYSSHQEYYRAVTEFKTNSVIFQPKGYYESFDDDGNPEFLIDDIFIRSKIPEISASKTVGGALLGVWSMLNHHTKIKNNTKIYVYSIKEKPDKDLSHVGIDDFEYIKEVRYKKPVEGEYVGYYIFDERFNKLAENFYERFNMDPWEDYTDEQIKWYNEFERYILTVSKNDLK